MKGRNAVKGFTYLLVLILVATLAGVLAAAGTRWATIDQRIREAELLRTGTEVRGAIGAYYQSSPGTVKQYPPSLVSLLRDARYLGIRRYLRKIPNDPMFLQPSWGLVVAPDGGVMGIHSQSDRVPFKTGNFSTQDDNLSGAGRYSDWQFIYLPPAPANPASPPFSIGQ
jgi:type II secretory pathway pseudopilin PulG